MAMRKLAPRLHYHDHHRHQEKQTLSAFNSKQQEHDIFSKRTGPVPSDCNTVDCARTLGYEGTCSMVTL
jgi:hypothetical protein